MCSISSKRTNSMRLLWTWEAWPMISPWIWSTTVLWLWWRGTPFKMDCRFPRTCCLTQRMPSSRKSNHNTRNSLKSPTSKLRSAPRITWSTRSTWENSSSRSFKTQQVRTRRTCWEILVMLKTTTSYITRKRGSTCSKTLPTPAVSISGFEPSSWKILRILS